MVKFHGLVSVGGAVWGGIYRVSTQVLTAGFQAQFLNTGHVHSSVG